MEGKYLYLFISCFLFFSISFAGCGINSEEQEVKIENNAMVSPNLHTRCRIRLCDVVWCCGMPPWEAFRRDCTLHHELFEAGNPAA